jgi:hypothetical protein
LAAPVFVVKVRFAILAGLTVIAAWLRFAGLRFGIPGTFRPDEEYMINPALSFQHDWNPHFALYPAAQMYLQHAALWAYATVHGQPSNFRSFYEGSNYPTAHVVARALSAAMGTATVPAIYLAGAPVLGATASLAASAIVAVATLHVLNSKFATADAAAVFWLAVTLAMVMRIADNHHLGSYLGAAMFAGVATATKYPAGAAAFAIIAEHLWSDRRDNRSLVSVAVDPRIYLAGLTMIGAFFCASPYVLLDWPQTVRDYEYQKVFVLYGTSAAGLGWRWLLLRAMPDSFGLGLEMLILSALVWVLVKRRPGAVAAAVFVAVTFATLSISKQLFYRYVLIPFPAMALLAGILVADLTDFAATLLGEKRGVMIVAAGFLLLLTPSFIRDIQLDCLLKRTDTRILALRFIEQHEPPGATIAEIDESTPYGKVPLRSRYRVVPFDNPGGLRANGVRLIVSDSYPPLFYSRGPSAAELAILRREAMLVFDADPILKDAPSPVFDPNDAFYVPLQHFSSVTRPGPHILIWRLK